MILSTVALLTERPDPDEDQIRHGLEGNICRCTGYQNIIRSVQRSAHALKESTAPTAIEGANS
jgi:carbon-monoxide dehydrogenase small subunit